MSRTALIVTTYNAPDYLSRVLDGYLFQERFPDELIVADDGSGAETTEVVERFALRSPFPVRHVWHEDRGFRAAAIRNEAVKATTADYLIFTDGDCIPHPRFVSDHLRLASSGWFVQGKRMLVGRGISPRFTVCGFAELAALCFKGELSGCHHLLRVPGFAREHKGLRGIKTCNFALSRADLLAVNGFNEEFTGWGREDAEFAARLFAYGLRRKDPPFSALVFHLWHEENSRAALAKNDQMLAEAMRSSAWYCPNGIVKENRP
ncbi:glycosyltransferase family 2 protein [Geobacter sulfurreducens]|uniref:glycosyltransferase family 2 protein n=1 Tax=Geobacter sulfurreducens TaxID=35554 RepID=UPI001BDDB091|nr:glycosyltransferase family 2 protein [Geobacter sulfurreducens]QVW34107.1 glycosyltransferase family 2 protein [Geobacter sulfurreducens]